MKKVTRFPKAYKKSRRRKQRPGEKTAEIVPILVQQPHEVGFLGVQLFSDGSIKMSIEGVFFELPNEAMAHAIRLAEYTRNFRDDPPLSQK